MLRLVFLLEPSEEVDHPFNALVKAAVRHLPQCAVFFRSGAWIPGFNSLHKESNGRQRMELTR